MNNVRRVEMSRSVIAVVSLPLVVLTALASFAGCSSKKTGIGGDDEGTTPVGDDDSGTSSGSTTFNNGSSSGFSSGGGTGVTGDTGPCKGGHYEGDFAGLYTSHITFIGFPIPVTGDVNLTLDQAGAAGQMCKLAGEIQSCDNVFELKNGVITGVADKIGDGDAAVGGFPYFCTMTGTLDCKAKKLVDGWIQCTYCIGPLADGGLACELGNGVGGTTGVGGHFAGPLIADYDYGMLAFVNGTWNGAEALAGNDGTMPGPDGGSIASYLADGGLYAGPGNYGGSGTWKASYKP
jgi:hypothetical protein